jgi:hypothetical protein
MAPENFTLIFDVTEAGYRQWNFPAFGLIFVAIGIGLLIYQYLRPTQKAKTFRRWFPFVYLAFAVVWTLGSFAATFTDYLRLRNAVRDGRCEIVEGTITDFVPMPYQGHAMEHFVVNGHYFKYSDFVVTAGFNNTQSHGGPLSEGKRVRICNVGGEIARLEIAW